MKLFIEESGLKMAWELESGQQPLLLHMGTGDEYADPEPQRKRHYGIMADRALIF